MTLKNISAAQAELQLFATQAKSDVRCILRRYLKNDVTFGIHINLQRTEGNMPEKRRIEETHTCLAEFSNYAELCTFEYTWSTAEEGTSSPAHHLCVPL